MGIRARVAKWLVPNAWTLEDDPRGERGVHKQEADRRATLPPGVERMVRRHNALPKPYDPLTLRDISKNPIAQAYIDTMTQDAATADWTLEAKDDTVTVSEGAKDEARERIMQLHPEMSFRDIREFFARDLLELGDSALVKHFRGSPETGELAEVVPVDSSRVFKKIDDHGFTEGYIQTSFESISKEVEFSLDEVVWGSWAQGGRENYFYGYGPTEKGKPVIDLLDELSDKELKDLVEGAPPGIVTARDSTDNPVPPEEFDRVDSNWELKEGQRHRHLVSRGSWEFVPISPGYDEMQILERSKFWVHSLGAVYKVNAPYAGFDFQEGNKAQNVAQSEAFRQRGFRVLLRYIEQAFNHQLLPHINEDLVFVFEQARTVDEQIQRAELREAQANAGKALVDAGLDVSFRDDQLVVEEGEMEAGSSGDGGGFFGEAGGVEFGARAKSGSVYQRLSKDEVLLLDEHLYRAHKEQIQPESIDAIEKRSWSGDESVPKFVQEAIEEAIDSGAVFSQFSSIPGDVRDTLEGLLRDNLTQPQGWSLRSLVNDAKDEFPGVSEESLELVMRTESGAVLNTAREKGYEDRDFAAEFKYQWQGASDSRTTDACEFMKNGSSAVDEAPRQFDGTHNTPLAMSDLKRLEKEVANFYFPSLTFRGDHVLHPNERHTFRRVVQT